MTVTKAPLLPWSDNQELIFSAVASTVVNNVNFSELFVQGCIAEYGPTVPELSTEHTKQPRPQSPRRMEFGAAGSRSSLHRSQALPPETGSAFLFDGKERSCSVVEPLQTGCLGSGNVSGARGEALGRTCVHSCVFGSHRAGVGAQHVGTVAVKLRTRLPSA